MLRGGSETAAFLTLVGLAGARSRTIEKILQFLDIT